VKFFVIIFMAALFLIGMGFCSQAASTDQVPRMTKEQLLPLLGSPDVVVLDARLAREWKASLFKIKGAVRLDSKENMKSMMETLPKDKTLVLYCD
jgi:rhodanese-related sulfurtransferase